MYLIIFSFWISGTQKTGLISGLTSTKSLANPSPHVPQTQQHTPQQSPISTPTTTSAPPLRPPLSPSRPKCNSVLHLFGTWLFEAALVGSDMTSFTSSSDRKFLIYLIAYFICRNLRFSHDVHVYFCIVSRVLADTWVN